MATRRISLSLPAMHASQQMVFNGRKKYNVGRCGRRWGKTLLAFLVLCQHGGILHGQPCAWFAPKNKHMHKVWREALDFLKPVILRKNATERVIEFIGGGELEFWSLEDVDAGKSRHYARAIIDEAELAKDLKYSWEQAISPTLTDLDGDAWFFSTPKGYTYFNELFELGNPESATYDPDWASWHLPTSSNPTIPKLEKSLARAKKMLPPLVYLQEYMAEVVDFGGTLIEKAWVRYGKPNSKEVVSTSMGVDLAISMADDAAYTAFVVMQMTLDRTIYIRAALKKRLKFNEVITEMDKMATEWQVDSVNIEKVQYQAAVVQEMVRTTKHYINGVVPDKGKDKLMRFLPLQPKYSNGLIVHDPDLPPFLERDVLGFPSTGDNDIPDAMVYAYGGLIPPNKGAVYSGKSESEQYGDQRRTGSSAGWGTV